MNYKDKSEACRKAKLLKYPYAFTPCIGIHRVAIKDQQIDSLDTSKLKSTFAKYLCDSSNYTVSNDGIPYSSISIDYISGYFNSFKAQMNHLPTSVADSSVVIDFSPSNPLELFSMEHLQNHYTSINSFLDETYGISLDSKDAKFKSVEISAEFVLQSQLSDYARVFHILKSLNTRETKIDYIKPDDNKNYWESCLFKNPSYELYVYDKSKELCDKRNILLSESVIKLELRIPKSYINQSTLKENISDITDEDIQNYFIKRYKRIIRTPFEKWHKDYISRLDELVDSYRKKYTHWAKELFKYCIEQERNYNIILLDYEDILSCPCILGLDKKKRNRIKKQVVAQFSDSAFSKHTITKIDELFDAIDNCASSSSAPVTIFSNKEL